VARGEFTFIARCPLRRGYTEDAFRLETGPLEDPARDSIRQAAPLPASARVCGHPTHFSKVGRRPGYDGARPETGGMVLLKNTGCITTCILHTDTLISLVAGVTLG
jgi:hypothetical protein